LSSTVSSATARTRMSPTARSDERWKKVKFIPSDMSLIYVFVPVRNNRR
jgi:hypothetical protein